MNDDSSQKLSQNQSHKQSHKLSQTLSQKLPRKARARRPSADLAYASDMSSTVGTPRRVWRKTMPSASRLSEKLKAPGFTKGEAGTRPGQAAKDSEASWRRTQHASDNGANADLNSYQWMNSQNRVFEDFII